MINIDQWTITNAVLQAQERCADPRLKEIMISLVTHLHQFAREVHLTENEWLKGIQFLTEAGHFTDTGRQEFILLSDTLGLSTLVTAQNNMKPDGFTEATVFGPFYVEGAPTYQNGDDIANGAKGEPCYVSGYVRGPGDEPIVGADIAVWQSDREGLYDVQRPDLKQAQARGNLRTLEDGRYYFRTIVAAPYPIPHDGPVGKMLKALGRHPWRPAHLHFMIRAAGYQTLITHVFRSASPYLDSDAVFGVRSTLIADWERQESSAAADESEAQGTCYTLRYDFRLYPIDATGERSGARAG